MEQKSIEQESMDINAKISLLIELYNQRRWAEADRMLDQIDKSIHYGTGRDDITWKSFFNLTHIIRSFSVDVQLSRMPVNLVDIETRRKRNEIE